jgi:predicted AlkP superfamily phosphohydrolase/phosphomutase/tetratricopeptide (TPR) repeat protein
MGRPFRFADMVGTMPERLAKRLLIIGWDAADWLIIDPLLARGALPNLRALVDGGVRADLRTLEPKLSPLLWTSIATGKTADRHGILGFVEPDPSGTGLRVAASTSRRTKAVWNMLSQSGLRTNAVSWYASHPAEPIRGAVVSNMFQEGAPTASGTRWAEPSDAIHASEACTRGVKDGRLSAFDLDRDPRAAAVLAPVRAAAERGDARVNTLARELARAISVHRAALEVMREGPWDCTLVFHDTIDTIGHHFMEFRPPRLPYVSTADERVFGGVMDAVYRLHDQLLSELLKAAPGATVLLLSDHGFWSDARRPRTRDLAPDERAAVEASWHRPVGVFVARGDGIRRGATIASPNVLDLTPTALALLGLPVGRDMDGRVVVEATETPLAFDTIASWDLVDGDAGLHPEDVRTDPFEARDALKQLVDLGYMAPPSADMDEQVERVRREARFNLGVVYATTGRPELATPVFRELVDACPGERRYIVNLARCLIASGRPRDAISALQAHPLEGIDVQLLLAAALSASGESAVARAALGRLADEARTPEDLAAIGDLYAFEDRWTEARAQYERALAADASNPAVHIALARALLALGLHEPAAEACLNATELQQTLPEAHYLLGVALAWLGMLDQAAQSLEIGLSLQPGAIDAHRFLAEVERARGKADAAARAEADAARLLGQLHDDQRAAMRRTRYDADAWREWVAKT